METYINLNIQGNEQSSIEKSFDFMNAMDKLDYEKCRSLIGHDCPEVLESFESLKTRFYEYFQAQESLEKDKDSVAVHFTCGGEGFNFLIRLIPVLGHFSNFISCLYTHDEESGEEGVEVIYEDGKIIVDGNEYLEEEEEEFDLSEWESPITDEVYDLFRKVSNAMYVDDYDLAKNIILENNLTSRVDEDGLNLIESCINSGAKSVQFLVEEFDIDVNKKGHRGTVLFYLRKTCDPNEKHTATNSYLLSIGAIAKPNVYEDRWPKV